MVEGAGEGELQSQGGSTKTTRGLGMSRLAGEKEEGEAGRK